MRISPAMSALLLLAASGTGPAASSGAASAADAADRTCKGVPATIIGTLDRDRLIGTSGPDVIVGLQGNDNIRGRKGDDLICGGRQDDRLRGGEGDDELRGQGNRPGFLKEWGDRFYDGPGDDEMHGGNDTGYDYLYYDSATSGIVVDRAAGTITGESSGNDTIKRIGVVYGSAYDDTMTNDDQTCEFHGEAGDDVIATIGECFLTGGPGNDVITAAAGEDFLLGDDGDDSLYGNGGDDYLDGGAGAMDLGDGGSGVDTCLAIEEPVDCESSPDQPVDLDAWITKWRSSGLEGVRSD